jgi:AcrR family transcriptional regulator
MSIRAESAEVTRQNLLRVARELLDEGGPDAVTLREVGARAGVSRTAAYRHFESKESLLMEVVTQHWTAVGDALAALLARPKLTPRKRLHAALVTFLQIARAHPRAYHLMYARLESDPTAAIRAAERTHSQFVQMVTDVVGPKQSAKFAALLFTAMHGIIGLELSGHLTREKWKTDADALLDLAIGVLPT